MTPSALTEAVAAVDQQVAAWLDGLAYKLAKNKEQYWRGAITTYEWQITLDESLAEMREVARLLRARPIAMEAKR